MAGGRALARSRVRKLTGGSLFSGSFGGYLILAWLAASLITGAALAGLARRIHETISFKKNWLYFSILMAAAMAAFFAIALH